MLQSLRVKNLAIVENIRVEFTEGLNVITGETGAGKSILVGALGLVLGERADRTMIRAGEDACGVEASFQLADSGAIDEVLEELGLDLCEDGHLIVRRIVSASGSGKNLINDCPTTVQVLKRLGTLLVDMHGPHDHQSLLDQGFQLELLDSFGHTWKPRTRYEEVYGQLKAKQRERDALEGNDEDVAGQIDLLRFQIQEIQDAELTDEDEETLEQEHKEQAHAAQILELAQVANGALTDGDESAFNAMTAAQRAIVGMRGLVDDAEEWEAEGEAVLVQIEELAKSIVARAGNIEASAERLRWLEDRMALLHRLKRKYGGSVEEIRAHLETASGRLASLEGRGEELARLDEELIALTTQVREAGHDLGRVRRTAAEKLGAAVTEQLRDLGFAHGVFTVSVEETEPGPFGTDIVDFGFAPNPGEPMRPLRTIASSGEISRVMLAGKAVLADHDRIPVLVFDEIDSNVGGEMGNAIGAKLGVVSQTHQVLCITHLPQVAAHGRTHYVVNKDVRDGRTHTHIELVERDARAEEVARMLGGKDLTSVALQHAREMLEKE